MKENQKTKVDELKEALKKRSSIEKSETAKETLKPEDESTDELSRQIHSAEEEAKNHYDKLLRVMAEFENFKKRMTKEREEQSKYANEKLLAEIVPALDDLDRVLDHVSPGASEEARKIADGVELVRKSLLSVLEKFGLKEVLAQGAVFDPAHHEAIAAVESESSEPNHVLAVHRKGYWLFDRLLRPAMVTVAKEATDNGVN